MQLLSSATFTLLLSTVLPGITASPVEQSANTNALEERAQRIASNMQCTSPAQMNLINDPGDTQLGNCGWKMWVACLALAGGVCFVPCAEGALADPFCDGCLATMGALGCKTCIQDEMHNNDLWAWETQYLAALQPQITQRLQSDYCAVPKDPTPYKLANGVSPGVPGETNSVAPDTALHTPTATPTLEATA